MSTHFTPNKSYVVLSQPPFCFVVLSIINLRFAVEFTPPNRLLWTTLLWNLTLLTAEKRDTSRALVYMLPSKFFLGLGLT